MTGKSSADGIETHIVRRYDIQKRLGKGAYGIVWRAIDKRKNHVVALKKIFDAFQNATDAQRTFREIVFLQEFGNHDNIIKLLNVIRADNDKDIYLVFEYMDTDLYAANKGGILQDVHKKYITYQIFKAIKYLHSGNVIHRDLKPSNILLNEHCFVKVCDFGLARSLSVSEHQDDTPNPQMTDYVATRWYRAPEILLGSSKYTTGVDMWSIGCIIGELLSGRPLFAGTSTLNQLDIILNSIDEPSQEDIVSIKAPYASGVLDRKQKITQPTMQSALESLIPNCPADAMQLMRSLLHFNPDKRSTAEDGCRHAYCGKFSNRASELNLLHDVTPPLNDNVQLTAAEYRLRLYEDIVARKQALNKSRTEQALSSVSDEATVTSSAAERITEDLKATHLAGKTDNTAARRHSYHYDGEPTDKQAGTKVVQNPHSSPGYTGLSAPYATTPVQQQGFRRSRSAGNIKEDQQPGGGGGGGGGGGTKAHNKTKSMLPNNYGRSQSAGKVASKASRSSFNNGPDLSVSSSRVMPNSRSSPSKQHPSRRPIGCPVNPNMPPKYGVSTHQHATVTKESLNALKSRQWL